MSYKNQIHKDKIKNQNLKNVIGGDGDDDVEIYQLPLSIDDYMLTNANGMGFTSEVNKIMNLMTNKHHIT